MDSIVAQIEVHFQHDGRHVCPEQCEKLRVQLDAFLKLKQKQENELKVQLKKQLELNTEKLNRLTVLGREIQNCERELRLQEQNQEKYRLRQHLRERVVEDEKMLRKRLEKQESTIKEIKRNLRKIKTASFGTLP